MLRLCHHYQNGRAFFVPKSPGALGENWLPRRDRLRQPAEVLLKSNRTGENLSRFALIGVDYGCPGCTAPAGLP
jgi:hypothetical protein